MHPDHEASESFVRMQRLLHRVQADGAGIGQTRIGGEIPAQLGLQIIGRAFDEATVLRAGRAIERAAEFKAAPQAWWKTA